MTVALTSKAAVLRYVNLSEDDDRFDSVLLDFATMASELIESYLGRDLQAVERQEFRESQLSQQGEALPQILWMGAYPIQSTPAPSVLYSPQMGHDAANPLVENRDFVVDYAKGLVKIVPNTGTYIDHPFGFKITYTGGYPLVSGSGWDYLDVPLGLATAAALQTAFFFNSHTRGSLGLDTVGGDNAGSQKTKGGKVAEGEFLIPEVRSALRPYFRKDSLLGRLR